MSFIASAKLIGITSVGALAVTSGFSAPHALSRLIHRLQASVGAADAGIRDNVAVASVPIWTGVLSAIASGAFWLSYAASSPVGKHPYLIYAAVGAPVAAAVQYYLCGPWLRKLHVANVAAPQAAATRSDDEELGKSYIHVSSDSSATSTPPASPQHTQDIDSEIESTLAKKQNIAALLRVRDAYLVSGGIAGLTFVVSVVGVVGDLLW